MYLCLRSKLGRVLSDIVKWESVSTLGSLYRKRVEDSERCHFIKERRGRKAEYKYQECIDKIYRRSCFVIEE